MVSFSGNINVLCSLIWGQSLSAEVSLLVSQHQVGWFNFFIVIFHISSSITIGSFAEYSGLGSYLWSLNVKYYHVGPSVFQSLQ